MKRCLTGLLCIGSIIFPSIIFAQQVFLVTNANFPIQRLQTADAQVCEYKDKLLVLADKKQVSSDISDLDIPVGRAVSELLCKPVIAVRRGVDTPLMRFADRLVILFEEGPVTVFQTLPSVLKRIMEEQSNHFQIMSFDENPRLHIPASRAFGDRVIKRTMPVRPEVSSTLGEKVQADRIMNDIKTLQDFKTRYTYEEGYVESAKWCLEQFKAMGYDVTLQEYTDSGKLQYNVVAKSKSATEGDSFYVVGAHLDSVSENPRVVAPGADDNGSGSAGALEMARVFAGTEFEKNLQFVLFAGEEVGLRGSTAYVRKFLGGNDKDKIRGAVILDMIGFDHKPPISGLLETKSVNESFIKVFSDEAAKIGFSDISVSYRPFGSDHMPFLNKQIPCFLFIETEYDDNPTYHKTTDTVEFVNSDLAEAIIKTSVMGLAKLLTVQ